MRRSVTPSNPTAQESSDTCQPRARLCEVVNNAVPIPDDSQLLHAPQKDISRLSSMIVQLRTSDFLLVKSSC